MITGQNVSLAAIFALLMGTVILYWQSRKRIAFDVLNDLSLVNEESTRGEKAISRGGLLDDELSQMGLLSLPERKRFLLIQKVIPCVGGIITLLWVGLILHASIVSCVIAGVAGVSLGYLLAERRKRILIERHKQALVYYLP
ncbi:MAG: hypothetical protein KDD62_15240, partial [Bdellovibrionales bacterium]|nr:hypothetical protein [Bdellovibrionales bacterium]